MGFVYFIQDESGRVKIGSSIDPENRLKQLQTSCAEKLFLIDSLKTDDHNFVEKQLHKKLKSLRINGEWFSLSRAMVHQLISEYQKVDISELEHSNSEISDLQQVAFRGIYWIPDAKYETYAVVTRCEYSCESFYVTEIATGKGFQHNSQYQINSVPSYWRRIESVGEPF